MKQKRYWLWFGATLAIVAVVLTASYAVMEYVSCSPDWKSMCGTGLFFVSIGFGLGTPIISLFILDFFIINFDINLGRNMEYIIPAIMVVVTMGIVYFSLGSLIGWGYGKIKNKK